MDAEDVAANIGIEKRGVHFEGARYAIHQVLIGLMHQENFHRGRGLAVVCEHLADCRRDFPRGLHDNGTAVHFQWRVEFEP
jgi:hypothetical protein